MAIKNVIISYLLTFLVFLFIDLIWLGFIAKNIYNRYLGNFLSDRINWWAAFIFYFLFVAGIFIFSVYPAFTKQSLKYALVMGALFGFFTYATYDLTNLATLKGWPLPIVIIDIIWGVVLSSTVAYCGYHITKWIN